MSQSRGTAYTLTLTTRSPLHIGNGRTLVKDYDFVHHEGVAYVVDLDAALRVVQANTLRRAKAEIQTAHAKLRKRIEQFDARPPQRKREREAQEQALREEYRRLQQREEELRAQQAAGWIPDDLLLGRPLGELVEAKLLPLTQLRERAEIEGRPLVRYVLAGNLSSSDEVGEQIKDIHGRPYIPGSSLKGALRTALAWHSFSKVHMPPLLEAITASGRLRDARSADTVYEQELFVGQRTGTGTDANRDLLRMLQVSDSTPAPDGRLILAPIEVYGGTAQEKGRDKRFNVLNVEAVAADTTFTTSIFIPSYSFDSPDARRRGLSFGERRAWLEAFVAAARERGMARIAAERAYYREHGPAELERFYAALEQEARSMGPDSFLLQIGWGTGWSSKTLDEHLRVDEHAFGDMVRDYGLNRPRRGRTFRDGDLFPKTRKLVLNGDRPWLPFGWVRVDVRQEA